MLGSILDIVVELEDKHMLALWNLYINVVQPKCKSYYFKTDVQGQKTGTG